MAQRSRFWRVGLGAFIAINIAGGIYAVVVGEPMHAAVHAVLLVIGVAVYSGFPIRRSDADPLPEETVERLKHLEASVDALAIGVERVGEAQRYQARILDEKAKARSSKKED